MGNRSVILVLVLAGLTIISNAQVESSGFSLMFYNTENLFDTANNPEAEDDSFTPDGEMHWTSKRFDVKILNISKVILSAAGWTVPDLLVFCEIENRDVLEKLLNETPLVKVPYKIIHKESPDHRGIDVALIYNSQKFSPISYEYFPLTENETTLRTREILYVSGILDKDTVHILGNHWPSRYGGLLETKEYRELAAKCLRSIIDDLQRKYSNPKIIITGDFNENPDSDILKRILKSNTILESVKQNQLYNLSYNWLKPNFGSLKFQSQWFVFDQIIVSGSLLKTNQGIFTKPENASLVTLPFLFEPDKKYGGRKPFRTYYGFDYMGGFSDHLPVLLLFDQLN